MKNQNRMPVTPAVTTRELFKPMRPADIYNNLSVLEALCSEFNAGSGDCQLANNSIDPDEDELLF